MADEQTRGRSGQTGLGEIRDEGLVKRKSSARVFVETVLRRWQMLLAIAAMAVTTYLLIWVDLGFSTDVLVFAGITVLMILYFVVTLIGDLRLE